MLDPELVRLIPLINIRTPEGLARFKEWQDKDGTVEGLRSIYEAQQTKLCKTCDPPIPKSLTEFYKKAASKDGYSNRCKECESKAHKKYYKKKRAHRKSKLKINYNITPADYERMFKNQNGMCAICYTTEAKLVVDHNHATGKVRQLLCPSCNHGLGRFSDNVAILQNAISYLERHA